MLFVVTLVLLGMLYKKIGRVREEWLEGAIKVLFQSVDKYTATLSNFKKRLEEQHVDAVAASAKSEELTAEVEAKVLEIEGLKATLTTITEATLGTQEAVEDIVTAAVATEEKYAALASKYAEIVAQRDYLYNKCKED